MQKIFVVEDDHVIREQLSKHLEMWNYEVYCCINFQYVLKDFEKFKPNLVLLDIKLLIEKDSVSTFNSSDFVIKVFA